jgi:hypothetical protein
MEESFNETKDKYKDLVSYKITVQNFLDKFNTIEIEGSDGLEDTIIDKRIYIQTKKNELEGMISEFRTMISEYTSSTNGDEKQSFISDAIDLYLNRITPVMKIIRDTLYEITTVLKEKGQFVLIQKEHDLKSMIIEIDPMTFVSGENDDDDDTDENDDDNTDEEEEYNDY